MQIKDGKLKIIGHGGAPALEPENTLLGYQRAIDLNCDMVEVDARLSKDNKIILIHDPTVNRTTNGKGFVAYKSLEELKKLDAGKGEKIPTLEEVWNLLSGKAELNIEIKEEKVLGQVILFIEKEDIKDKVLVSSRYYWLLAKIKKSNPQIRTALVSYLPLASIWQAKKGKVESIHPITTTLTAGLLKKAHENNLKVYPFPLERSKKEEPVKIKELIKAGVDGIFLNDPGVLKKV